MSDIKRGRYEFQESLGSLAQNFINIGIYSLICTLALDLLLIELFWPRFFPFMGDAWEAAHTTLSQKGFLAFWDQLFLGISLNFRLHLEQMSLERLFIATPVLFVLCYGGLLWWFRRAGGLAKKEVHLRGSGLISSGEYTRQVRQLLKKKIKEIKKDTGRAPDFKELWGTPFICSSDKKVQVPEYRLGRNTLMRGMPGSGKTSMIKMLMERAREQQEKCFVVDPNGEFYSEMAQEGDIILSLYDKRSELWNFSSEKSGDKKVNPKQFAEFLVPEGKGEPLWWKGPRAVLKFLLENTDSAEELWRYLENLDEDMVTSLEGIAAQVAGKAGSGQAAGVVAGTVMDLEFLQHLNYWPRKNGKKDPVSVYDWAQNSDRRWIFITYTDDDKAVMEPLLKLWINLVILGVIARNPNKKNIPLNLIVDELGSVGVIEKLDTALQRFRKYGGRLILGLQSAYQFFQQYPLNRAKDLMSLVGNMFIFRTDDEEESKNLAKLLGEEEVLVKTSSRSFKTGNESIGESVRKRLVVPPEDIQTLPDGHYYLKSVETRAVRTRIKHKKWPQINPDHRYCHAYPPVDRSEKFRKLLDGMQAAG